MRLGVLPTLALAIVATLSLATLRGGAPDPLTDRVENALLDLRFRLRGEREPPAGLVVVAIDEHTLSRYPTTPELRGALAEAIDRARAGGAAAIALDLLLLETTAADPALAETLAAAGNTVLAAGLAAEAPPPAGPLPPEVSAALDRSLIAAVLGARDRQVGSGHGGLLLPGPQLAGTGLLGHVNIQRSPDRVARRAVVAVPVAAGDTSGFLPALPVTAVRLAAGLPREAVVLRPGDWIRIGRAEIATGREGEVTLDHYGPAGTIPTRSLRDLIERAAPEDMAGRIVLFGATAESLRDVFATPFSANVAGVEVLATFAGNLVEGRFIRRGEETFAMGLGLALLLVCGAFAAGLPQLPVLAAGLSISVWTGGAAAVAGAFVWGGLWLDAVTALGALVAGSVAGAVVRDRTARAHTAALGREKANIARYLPPGLGEALAGSDRPAFDRREQQVAVLFVDVADYTARSEAMSPVAVADFLGRLHGVFEECALAHGGVVVDFLGDGAMMVFGLPDASPGDAAAAIACGEALSSAGRTLAAEAELPVRLRISIHYGTVAAAIIGGPHRAHATVTGDTVNLASRLQETAKRHGRGFVVTRAALEAAGRLEGGAAEGFGFLAVETPRGRRASVEVWAQQATAQETRTPADGARA